MGGERRGGAHEDRGAALEGGSAGGSGGGAEGWLLDRTTEAAVLVLSGDAARSDDPAYALGRALRRLGGRRTRRQERRGVPQRGLARAEGAERVRPLERLPMAQRPTRLVVSPRA